MRGPVLSERLATLRLQTVGIGELSQLIADEALRLLGGERAVVWVYRQAVGRLFLEQTSHEIRSVALDAAQAAEVLGAPVAVLTEPPDGVTYELIEASLGVAAAERPRRVLLLPLGTDETAIGLLVIDAAEVTGVERQASHQALAAQAGTLLANHEALANSRGHEAQLEALYQTVGEVSAKLDTETVLTAIIQRARQLVRAPISYITLVDEGTDHLYMRSAVGVEHPAFHQIRLRIGTGLGGMAAKQEKAFYTSDYLNDARFTHTPSVDAAVRAEGIKSILGVPMRASTQFVGVLYAADRGVRVFTDGDVDILLTLARHAALAIDNAALYEGATAALSEVRNVNEVVKRQNNLLERIGEVHRRFSEVMLADVGLPEIVGLGAGLLHGSVVVLDARLRPLRVAGDAGDVFSREITSHGVVTTRADSEVLRAVKNLARPGSTVVDRCPPSRQQTWVTAPVIASAEVLGSVWAPCDPECLDEDRAVIEEAARAVALELLKQRSVAEVERRLGREFLDELFAQRPALTATVELRAGELGVDLSRPHRLAVIGFSTRLPGREQARTARDEIIARLRAGARCSFVADHGDRLVALVRPEESPTSKEVLERLMVEIPGSRVVVSPACAELRDYRRHFLACDRILRMIAERLRTPVIDLEEMRVLALLLGHASGEEVREFVRGALGALLDHDEEHGSELVSTLDTYFQAGLSPQRAAAALHVHKNTVYYRLERIKEFIGSDFASPRRALDLQVALLARMLLDELDATSSSGAATS